MTSYPVFVADIPELRRFFPADINSHMTSGMEITTSRRIHRTRYITGEKDTFSLPINNRVRDRKSVV